MICGAFLKKLSSDESREILIQILGRGSYDKGFSGLYWALIFCADGVVWGKLDERGWRLSSDVFPNISPSPSMDKVLELRVFGYDREILIWRDGDDFRGRMLDDRDAKGIFKPLEETRVLLGNRLVEAKDGFSWVSSPEGREQVVPVSCTPEDFKGGRWPLRLRVKHYFSQDEATGVLRVVASRLVGVFKEGSYDP